MDHEEVSTVTVDDVDLKIVSPMPAGPTDADYQVWHNNTLLFIINPHLESCDEPCWKLADQYNNIGVDPGVISRIGEEIERHYI